MADSTEITWTIGPTSGDSEIDAMRQLLVVLRPLDPSSRGRVLRWIADRETPPSNGGDDGR